MIQEITMKIYKEINRKIDYEFFRLMDKHNLSVLDFINNKYKLVIKYKILGVENEYSIVKTDTNETIDKFTIKINIK